MLPPLTGIIIESAIVLLRREKATLWNPYEDPSKAHSADVVGH